MESVGAFGVPTPHGNFTAHPKASQHNEIRNARKLQKRNHTESPLLFDTHPSHVNAECAITSERTHTDTCQTCNREINTNNPLPAYVAGACHRRVTPQQRCNRRMAMKCTAQPKPGTSFQSSVCKIRKPSKHARRAASRTSGHARLRAKKTLTRKTARHVNCERA